MAPRNRQTPARARAPRRARKRPTAGNTLEAFAAAAAAGVDGVELDVRECSTGEIVVHHDPTLGRMTGGADSRPIASVSWPELCRIDLGRGARIPRLTDVLAFAKENGLLVNVEMKRDTVSRWTVVRKTAAIVSAWPDAADRIIVSSFDPVMLGLFGAMAQRVARGLLFHHEQGGLLRSGRLAGPLGASAVHSERVLVSEDRCRRWHERGLAVNVWTVNDPDEARLFSAWGVDAIITDDPRTVAAAARAAAVAASSPVTIGPATAPRKEGSGEDLRRGGA